MTQSSLFQPYQVNSLAGDTPQPGQAQTPGPAWVETSIPRISIVIPAYNAAATLPGCLQALQIQAQNSGQQVEVIVVDDGSSDRTVELARDCGAHVLQQTHGGPAVARNAGAQAARGELLLFLDSDCTPAVDWIEQMVKPFADSQVVGVKGVFRTRQKELTARFVQAEYEDKDDLLRRHSQIDFIDTGSAAYRRQIFLDNGSFDTGFPRASGEDVDFSYRLARRGYKLVLAPEAIIYHPHPTTLKDYFRRKYYTGYWRNRMYQRHPSKMIVDSRTPQSLKLQMGLLLAGVPAFAATLFWPGSWVVISALVLLFVISTLPFILKNWMRDKTIALLAPFFFFWRSLALDAGFLTGFVVHLWNRLTRR